MNAKGRKPKKGRVTRKKNDWQEAGENEGLDRFYGGLGAGDDLVQFDVDSYIDNLDWESPESFEDY